MTGSFDHNALAHDLAMFLSTPPRGTARGRLTWENIQFPWPHNCRPDVFSLVATLTANKWCPVTYEVKANRPDFLCELRSSKWRVYRPFSAYVFMAFPEGLADDSEVPPELGVIVKHSEGWKVRRRGRRNPDWRLGDREWMNLCLKGRNPSPFEIFTERRAGRALAA